MRACWLDAYRNDVMPTGNVWHVTDKARLCRACSRRVIVSRVVASLALLSLAWLVLVIVAA